MAAFNEATPKEVLEFRRCILLTIVGITSVESPSLKHVLENDFLAVVKTWFDEILNGTVGRSMICILNVTFSLFFLSHLGPPLIGSSSFPGGVDLLLHLLTNIKNLPVTKNIVKHSGMGKAIGSIEKHPICAGTPNQSAIMDRVHEIKAAWNASVKARKDKKVSSLRQSCSHCREISFLIGDMFKFKFRR